MHGGLSPDMQTLEMVHRIIRPIEVPDQGKYFWQHTTKRDKLFETYSDCFLLVILLPGLLCDLLWSDPEKDILGWGDNERGVSYIFGPDIVSSFLKKHDLDLICRAHQVVEDGYEFFAKRQLVTVFSAPNYCGEFDNSGELLIIVFPLIATFGMFFRFRNFL